MDAPLEKSSIHVPIYFGKSAKYVIYYFAGKQKSYVIFEQSCRMRSSTILDHRSRRAFMSMF